MNNTSSVCPRFHQAVELIGRRWSGAILNSLLQGECRFSQITNSIDGLSDRLLSERLKELEREGLVERQVFPETPVRIEYHLTDKGLALSAVMESISEWAEYWLPAGGVPEPKDEASYADRELVTASTQPAE